MDLTEMDELPKKEKVAVDVDFDEDSFSFRPLTEGLGFHQERHLKKSKIIVSPTSTSASKFKTSRISMSRELSNVNFTANSESKGHLSSSGELEILAKSSSKERANWGYRLLAWLIDLTVVLLMLLPTMFFVVLIADINLENIFTIIGPSELAFFSTGLFLFYYLFYFSILDLSEMGTVGKSLFRLKLEKIDRSRLKMADTLIRSLISLASVFSLGFFSLIDLAGKLTETQIIHKEKK